MKPAMTRISSGYMSGNIWRLIRSLPRRDSMEGSSSGIWVQVPAKTIGTTERELQTRSYQRGDVVLDPLKGDRKSAAPDKSRNVPILPNRNRTEFELADMA